MVGVRVIIDDFVPAYIPLRNISDDYSVEAEDLKSINPREKIKIGMVIHARIVRINYRSHELVLSSRTSDLQDLNSEYSLPKDANFDETKLKELQDQMLNSSRNGDASYCNYSSRGKTHIHNSI